MPKYLCNFTGRTKGAIGIFYRIAKVVEAPTDDPDAIRTVLYEEFEHIQQLTVREVVDHDQDHNQNR